MVQFVATNDAIGTCPAICRAVIAKVLNSITHYDHADFYDEMIVGGGMRPHAEVIGRILQDTPWSTLARHQVSAERMMRDLGATFTVYGNTEGTEKILPFDIVPRLVTASDWSTIEQGLIQRVEALNLFLQDIYGDQKILKEGKIPEDVIRTAAHYRPICQGMKPPLGVWCHITGTDLVRDAKGQFYVLEDNLRCPSGVSYVLENRRVMKRIFPELFRALGVRPVEDYPDRLLDTLQAIAPRAVAKPGAAGPPPKSPNRAGRAPNVTFSDRCNGRPREGAAAQNAPWRSAASAPEPRQTRGRSCPPSYRHEAAFAQSWQRVARLSRYG